MLNISDLPIIDFQSKDYLTKPLETLAKLSQNQLKGEALTQFIQRSVDMIK